MGDAPLPTDADLVAASLQDPERFGLLFDRHALAVYRYVAYRARGDDVDDAVSETFDAQMIGPPAWRSSSQ